MGTAQLETVQGLVKDRGLHTICEEGAAQPSECYAAGTATFLLGGSICTRAARLGVEKGKHQ